MYCYVLGLADYVKPGENKNTLLMSQLDDNDYMFLSDDEYRVFTGFIVVELKKQDNFLELGFSLGRLNSIQYYDKFLYKFPSWARFKHFPVVYMLSFDDKYSLCLIQEPASFLLMFCLFDKKTMELLGCIANGVSEVKSSEFAKYMLANPQWNWGCI